MATHYMYLEERKFYGFVINKVVEIIVQARVLKACVICVTGVMPSLKLRGTWQIKPQSSNELWYMVDHLYIEYASCSCERQWVGIFANINVQLFYKTWMLRIHIYWSILDLTMGPIVGFLKQYFKHLYLPPFFGWWRQWWWVPTTS